MYTSATQIAKLFSACDQVTDILLYRNSRTGEDEIIILSDGEYPTPGMIFETKPFWVAFLSWLSYASSGDAEYNIPAQPPEKILRDRFWVAAKLLGIKPEGKISFYPAIWLFPSFWREKESLMRSCLGKHRELYGMMLEAQSFSE